MPWLLWSLHSDGCDPASAAQALPLSETHSSEGGRKALKPALSTCAGSGNNEEGVGRVAAPLMFQGRVADGCGLLVT